MPIWSATSTDKGDHEGSQAKNTSSNDCSAAPACAASPPQLVTATPPPPSSTALRSLVPREAASPLRTQTGRAPSSSSSASALAAPPSTDDAETTTEARRVALAASFAAVLTKSVLHPIDTVKCRLQVVSMAPYQPAGRAAASSTTVASNLRHGIQPSLSLSQRLHQLRSHYAGYWGPRYLYGGLPVKLLMYVPYQTTYMVTYESAKKYLHTTEVQQSQSAAHPVLSHLWRTTAAAVVAEIGSCAIRIPMETVKMRIQATEASSTTAAFRQIRRNGARACARLIIPHTLAHDVPYSITQWVIYETLRPWTMSWHARKTSETQEAASTASSSSPAHLTRRQAFWQRYGTEMQRAFLSGGFSGFLASALTIPLDNIRTRTVVASANNPNVTARQVVRRTLEQEGVRGFFKGGGMRVVWVTSNLACYFPVFELMKSLLTDTDQ